METVSVGAAVPFRAALDPAALQDLRTRLMMTRWPPERTEPAQGISLDRVQQLCETWSSTYDFGFVDRLNAWPQFTAPVTVGGVDPVDVHFLHVRSPEPGARPLVLTHGWPGSVLEFLDVIGPLTDPVAHGGEAEDAFHVVIPALPGFGFSGVPTDAGWTTSRIAVAWDGLMQSLGYDTYLAQGGDWGASVTNWLAAQFPDRVLAIHVNMVLVRPDEEIRNDPTEAEAVALAAARRHQREGAGYAAIQSTRPQTVGYALTDSPAGLCAWIAEKYAEWSDVPGPTDQQILDEVSLYWFTGTAATSARLYRESYSAGFDVGPIPVPSAVSVYPREIGRPSERWARLRHPDLRFYENPSHGGHFAALEVPEMFVDQVRRGFRACLG
ncbi:alpha/beta fold hydrolase [Nakamurella sp. YIM 132087]|uniref:Alpha/beta fold hydrolase n=1 Tax=Nakamurella alba TaxID=2665158 RepID=A0A7K1FPM0_9ACTN|nr:epoxide hydrolase family protein [Nakamurella alba]MTD16030.1 alpha/beta fold hydrolase [Nakamurella alba]